jgi:hypothetical protein
MTEFSVTPTQVMAGVGVLLVLILVWRSSVRRARAAANAVRSGARLLSLTGRVLLLAGLLVGAQWVVFLYPDSLWLRLAVLGLPDLFAAYALTRALTVTTVDTPGRRGGRR